MDPEVVRAWLRVLRDFVIVVVAAFLLVHEALAVRAPDPTLVGAGLALLLGPAALRADEWLRKREKPNGG
ncbi:MAG: hypothetical protein M3364_04490 [Actinomycetota bacterium]|nr:hypothetical protein [Actinomycetota bacterium]